MEIAPWTTIFESEVRSWLSYEEPGAIELLFIPGAGTYGDRVRMLPTADGRAIDIDVPDTISAWYVEPSGAVSFKDADGSTRISATEAVFMRELRFG